MGNTLAQNKINQFILRIDLLDDRGLKFDMIVPEIEKMFDSYKSEMEHNLNILVEEENLEKRDFVNYVFNSSDGTTLKLQTREKAIVFETNHYLDNSIYKERLNVLIGMIMTAVGDQVTARRIGLRYVNSFPCAKVADVRKVLNLTYGATVSSILKSEQLTRAIVLEEYQHEDCYARVQYGIPNKFYPSLIKSLDLLLDIDVFQAGAQFITDWAESVKVCNHKAFEVFRLFIKEDYLAKLK